MQKEKSHITAANVPAFILLALRETLPGGTILTRQGLTQYLLTLPKSRGAVLFEKARTVVLKFDDESSKQLHNAFQAGDEEALFDCGEWIRHAVQSYFIQHPATLSGQELIQIGLFAEDLNYRRG